MNNENKQGENAMYNAKSQLTKRICEELGFKYEVEFVETMVRKGKVYVRGTAGKPNEFQSLKTKSASAGYYYVG